MSSIIDLHGKTILVAGAAGLLGKEIVSGLLASGANVLALDRNEGSLRELEGNWPGETRLTCAAIDIASATSISSALALGDTMYGKVDGAVNTAYPRNYNYGNKFFDVTYSDFCENTALHLGGYFLFMQQCAKYAVSKEINFSLVNMSSVYGVIAPRFEVYADTLMTMPVEYAAIKSGLMHLTRYVSAFMKESRFRANCVSPGGILAGQNKGFIDKYNEHCRVKGMLDSRDVLGAVLFLLSDASEFMVGQNIIVDDGFSL